MKPFYGRGFVALLAFAGVASGQSVAERAVKSAATKEIRQVYSSMNPESISSLPIGVFDSGTGGLTVLEQILTIDAFENHTSRLMPRGDGKTDFANESFVFLADQANMPYGNYPVVGKGEFLEDLIVKDAWFLMGRKRFHLGGSAEGYTEGSKSPVKAIVIACNTATAYGQDDIEDVIHAAGLDIKVVGVIDAGAKGAVESLNGRDGTIGVVPTMGTVLSNAYPAAIDRMAESSTPKQRIEVVQQGAFGLAGAIDGAEEFILIKARNSEPRNDYRGPSMTHADSTIRRDILNRYAFDFTENRMLYRGDPREPTELQLNAVENYIAYHLVSLMEQIRADEDLPPLRAVILGCTHFPFYKETFRRELERLRDYQEHGEFIYRKQMAEKIELIDPAYFTARELYQSLAADRRIRSGGQSTDRRAEFCITVPCRELPDIRLNGNGGFAYDYKYSRNAGTVPSAFRAVSLDERTVDQTVLRRLQERVPTVWALVNNDRNRSTSVETVDAKEKIDRLEQLIAEDIGSRRGIEPLAKTAVGGLYGAAKSIAGHPHPNVAIITGFYFPYSTPPNCETDGPPGAAHIALALHRAGIPCRVATDLVNERVVHASLWGAGLPGDFPVDTISMDDHGVDGGKPLGAVIEAWRNADPPITHVVSVERGGPAADGKPHNFSGDDISDYNAPLHKLFEAGDWIKIGIGDGGNEIGMGKLPSDLIAKHVKNGGKVACVTKCDHLIVCGTSNWGGWMLPAAVGILRPDLRARLLAGVNREVDHRILKVAVEKGKAAALESFEAQRAFPNMSVDALPWEVHAQKLDELLRVINEQATQEMADHP